MLAPNGLMAFAADQKRAGIAFFETFPVNEIKWPSFVYAIMKESP
jgi:hypothetical protein